jgi:hypothetical protein
MVDEKAVTEEKITAEEKQELAALRADRKSREAAEKKAAEEAAAAEPEPAYWLTLANGDVIESTGQMTHYKGIPVVSAHRIVEEETTNA